MNIGTHSLRSRSLRIALLCREYPPDTLGGGIGTYTANIARGLARAGHSVTVISQAIHGGPTVTQDDRVSVHRVSTAPQAGRRALRVAGDGKSFFEAYLYARAAAHRVQAIGASQGLDVVQSPEHGAEGFSLSTHRGTPAHVVRLHTPLFMVNEAAGRRLSLGGRIVNLMERTVSRRALLNTCASRALATVVASRFQIPHSRIRIVPNFMDHERFRPASSPVPRALTVLYVGKIAPLKGASTLSRAIPRIVGRVQDVRIVIVGSDHPGVGTASTRAEMLEDLQKAGVGASVTFIPTVTRDLLVPLYQGADVYVLPTLWDNFPNTCLEAMSCGVPVVATAVGGLPEIIDDGTNGVLVPPDDPERLAGEVIGLLERPERRRQMGQAARAKILSTYTMERVVEATVAVYEEAMALWRNGSSSGRA